jgi:hypothetical protein
MHANLEDELCSIFKQGLRTAGFIGGPMVESFEAEFAKFCDTQYCVGVASGTDALRFALMVAGVEPGTIVVTVPNTFIATGEASRRRAQYRTSLTSMNALTTWTRRSCGNSWKWNAPQTKNRDEHSMYEAAQ